MLTLSVGEEMATLGRVRGLAAVTASLVAESRCGGHVPLLSSLRSGFSSIQDASQADTVATQMIQFAGSCRKQEASHGQAVRVLEQGVSMTTESGQSEAGGKLLLTLATFYADRANWTAAEESLQRAADLEEAPLRIRVAALEALTGVCLRTGQDGQALSHAQSSLKLVKEAGKQQQQGQLEDLEFRATAAVKLAAMASPGTGSGEEDSDPRLPQGNGGLAAAILVHAECAHTRGKVELATELYNAALEQAKKPGKELAAVAMAAEEVSMAALAGLGQLRAQQWDFTAAEADMTEALKQAESINGDRHPRVGLVLSCLAQVYALRGQADKTGDVILPEGLFRRALELVADRSKSGSMDLREAIALCRARYASVLSAIASRSAEADRLHSLANASWTNTRPLAQVLEADFQRHAPRRCLLDVRLGRLF